MKEKNAWPILFKPELVRQIMAGKKIATRRVVKPGTRPRIPLAAVGNMLWVRECFQVLLKPHLVNKWLPAVGPLKEKPVRQCRVVYAADRPAAGFSWEGPWRPGIHMPRWACRLRLSVFGIYYQRVQDMTADDAQREGVLCDNCEASCAATAGCTCLDEFRKLWDRINGARGYAWKDNPAVQVIDFLKLG